MPSTWREPSQPPGGVGRRYRARQNGRKGGLASGVKRRQLAKGHRPSRVQSRRTALALAYRHRQLPRRRFNDLYAIHFPEPERPSAAVAWRAGRDTCWMHYMTLWRVYRRRGQHYRTTNGQRAVSLASHGRPRCTRTVQRCSRRLDLLGLAKLSHYRDQGATPGHKDCLVVEIGTPPISHVTPPLRGRANRDSVPRLALCHPEKKTEPPPETSLSPPASPADEIAADAASDSTEMTDFERRFRIRNGLDVAEGDMRDAPQPRGFHPVRSRSYSLQELESARRRALELAAQPAVVSLREWRRLRPQQRGGGGFS